MGNTLTILLLALLAGVFLLLSRKKSTTKKESLVEATTVEQERVICVYDITEVQIDEVVDEFVNMYSENGDVEKPTIRQEGDHYRLTFSSKLDYISMCYWVNYLTYSDESRQTVYKVRGWYPFGKVQYGQEPVPFSNQTVMFFVDKDDKEYDNVSFVTPDGIHYLQPFAIADNLSRMDDCTEKYIPLP